MARIRPSTMVMPRDDGQEGEEAHPCAAPCKETLCTVKLFLLYVEVFLYPVDAAKRTYPVVEHTAEGVAYGAVGYQRPRVKPRGHEPKHYYFAAKRKYAAGEECRKSIPT